MNAWEKNIRKVTPYTPGEQPKRKDIIKLNTNENPYPPAPGVQQLSESFQTENLRRYPDINATPLVDVLAEYYHVGKNQVFVGVGSDDVLAVAFMTFFASEKPLLFPDITYSFYDVWASLFRIPYETKALDGKFQINPRDYDSENGGVIFPNPNAPTAVSMPLDTIRDILNHNRDVIVIVDEAYIDFADVPSAICLLEEYQNLVVVQTFSKSRAMAGERIGYAIASPELIRAMNAVKHSFNSYTMNMSSLALGVEAVKDDAYFKMRIQQIKDTREWTKKELSRLGFTFPDAQANFIFASHITVPAKELFEKLKEKGIFVRYFSKDRIDNYLRITIGTKEEMQKLVDELKKIVK